MATAKQDEPIASSYAEPASLERLQAAAQALEANGFGTRIVNTAEDAKRAVLDLIPLGSEVHTGASVTLETLGLHAELESGRYDSIRPKYLKLDHHTQMPEIRKLMSSPAFMLASVAAVTEEGSLILASAMGSQISPIVFGASTVILVIGAQKIVRNLDEALQRIEDYCLPLEDQRAFSIYGAHSGINKLLVLNKEKPGRIHVVLVREPLGY